jgi:hypothetical protein
MNHTLRNLSRMLTVLPFWPGLLLLLVLTLGAGGCGGGEDTRTYYGKLVAIECEHRNVAEYEGEGGPVVSLLVTAGRVQGAFAEDGIKLYYRVDGEPFEVIPMSPTTSGRRFTAEIPHQESGSKVNYYIEVTHRLGKRLTFPAKAGSGVYYTIRIK